VRVSAPAYPSGPFDYEALLKRTIDRYAHVVSLAKPFNVKLVIETHAAGIASSPGLAWNIVRHFEPADVGVILDLPNFAIEGNLVPHVAVAVLGKWIDHVHVGGVRRATGSYDAHGFRRMVTQTCPLAESDLHILAWLDAIAAAGQRLTLVIEGYSDGIAGAARLKNAVESLRRLTNAPAVTINPPER